MPIWSLTNERLEKLKDQIAAKKAEHDELNALSEKDLWLKDLDDFVEEWHTQLKLEEEITSGIRRMGRRASQKIGAGRGRRPKGDDDYQPEKKSKPKAPKVEKVETKTHQRFTEKFQAAAQPTPKNDLSDDDFALLGKKAVVKEESQPPASVTEVTAGRAKRATATKSKYVLSDDSEDDDDFMDLGKPNVKNEVESDPEVVEQPPKRAAAKAKPSRLDDDFDSEIEEVAEQPVKRTAAKAKPSRLDDAFDSEIEEVVEKPVKRAAAAKPKPSYLDDEDASDLEEVIEKPTKRAAAKKAKPSYMEEEFGSESDDDNMLGDVGALVKGIGRPATSSSNGGRLSLFAMSRPEAGETPLPKMKTKASKSTLEIDDHDDTNYEALAMSSPRKSTKADDLDDFLSDDDLPAATKPASKPAAQTAASKAKAPLSVVPAPAKKRGRPAGSKNKPKDDDDAAPAPKAKPKPKTVATAAKAKAKPTTLSPAAKAYAAKKAKAKKVISDDEDEIMDDAPAPVAAKPKARPGRAAAAKAKPVYLDDDEDDSFVSAGSGGAKKGRKDDSDAFDMDDDSD